MRIPIAILLLAVLAAPALGREPDPWTFTGNRSYSADDLVEQAPEEFEHFRRLRDETAAEDAAWSLGQFYLDEGYPLSRVEVQFSDDGRALFLIREGPRIFLGNVFVDTDRHAETLADFVDPPNSWLLGTDLYIQSELESAGTKMTAWLRQHGYLEAEVTPPKPLDFSWDAAYPDELYLDVHYSVKRGPRYLLRDMEFVGFGDLEDEAAKAMEPLLHTRWTPFTPYDIKGTLEEFYANRGYPWAKVTVETSEEHDPDGESVYVTARAEVDPGPFAKVGPIRIFGDYRVRDEAIRRELTVIPGDPYDGEELLASQQQIFATGLFSQVNASLVNRDEAPEVKDGKAARALLGIRVEEVDFRRFETSVGFGSWDLLRGSISQSWLNLDGYGRSARIQLAASYRGYELRGSLGEPWVFGITRLRGKLEGAIESQERPTFTYDRLTLGASVSKLIGYKLVGSLGWALSRTDVTNVSGDVPTAFENTTNLSSFTLGLTREARNNPWDPTKGSLLSGTFEIAEPRIGSDLAFVRTRLRAIQVYSLSKKNPHFLVAGIAEVGAISPYGSTDVIPIQERFFLGGSQSVRSFEEDDLGPRLREDDGQGGTRETGTAAGGEFMSRVSVELRIPIAGSLETALFVDGGNVKRQVRDAGLSDYRFAVGTGIRYRTPLGPIRIDFGVNPDPKDREDRWQVFFAIGYPF